MTKPFYIGSYQQDALNDQNRGWIVGKFKDDPPRRNDAVEIKYWEYPVGPVDHPTKKSSIIECTFILRGKTRAILDGKEYTLSAGDYVVIDPGTPNNVVIEALEDVVGLTVKAPSDPTAKTVIE